MEIVSATSEFDFKTITLADPQPLSGAAGFYFTPLSIGDANDANDASKSLCLQLPQCVSKQGIVNVKNAKYLDLMFERDKHDDLTRWLETLEYTCQDIIDSKKDLWFQTELTRDDIETMMTQIIRLYQSGKYMLMRVFIDAPKIGQKCIAYDENELGFDLDTLEANKNIIPLVMIEGVKFSSRSFEISLKLVQVMVMGKIEKKSSCLIKRPLELKNVINKAVATAKTVATVAPALKVATVATVATVAKAPTVATVATVAKAPTVATVATVAKAPTVTKAPTVATVATAATVIKASEEPLNKQNLNTLKPIIKKINAAPNTEPVAKAIPPAKTVALVPITLVPINLEKRDEIEEINIDYNELSDSIRLKNPNEVYYEMYKSAREKAKHCRLKAIEAYLEAKQIKTKYMLDDLDDDDDSDDSEDEQYNVETD